MDSRGKLALALAGVRSTGFGFYDYELTGLNVRKDKVTGVSFSWPEGGFDKPASVWCPVDSPLWAKYVREVFECGAQFGGWKTHFDMACHHQLQIPLYPNHHDAKAMRWLRFPQKFNPKGLKAWIEEDFGVQPIQFKQWDGKSDEYPRQAAEYTCRFYGIDRAILEQEGLWPVYERTYPKLTPIAVEMLHTGMRVDLAALQALKILLEQGRLDVLGKLRELDEDFNPNSPREVASLLYDRLKLKPPMARHYERGPAGHQATGKEILNFMAGQHAAAGSVLEYRKLSKLLGTYISTLIRDGDREPDHRIHAEWGPYNTDTGRWSSRHLGKGALEEGLNLQNIPKRGDLGKAFRRCFVASPGWKIVRADLGQIEMRVMAYLSNAESMRRIFSSGRNIHQATADAVPCDYEASKSINFGFLYGMRPAKYSLMTGCSKDEAVRFRNGFFRAYPELAAHHSATEVRVMGRDPQYLASRMLDGRLHDLQWYDHRKGERLRKALNTPVQGSVGGFVNKALIDFVALRDCMGYPARLLAQVHDEIVLEVRADFAEEVAGALKDCLVRSGDLGDIPIVADVTVGDRWKS